MKFVFTLIELIVDKWSTVVSRLVWYLWFKRCHFCVAHKLWLSQGEASQVKRFSGVCNHHYERCWRFQPRRWKQQSLSYDMTFKCAPWNECFGTVFELFWLVICVTYFAWFVRSPFLSWLMARAWYTAFFVLVWRPKASVFLFVPNSCSSIDCDYLVYLNHSLSATDFQWFSTVNRLRRLSCISRILSAGRSPSADVSPADSARTFEYLENR